MKKTTFYLLALGALCLGTSSPIIGADAPTLTVESSPEVDMNSVIFPFNTMTADDAKTTGIQRLSVGEQERLLDWIRGQDMALNPPVETTLSQVKEEGKIVELANGQSFTCNASVRKKVAQWQEKNTIAVYSVVKPRRTYTLKNVSTGDVVRARPHSPKK